MSPSVHRENRELAAEWKFQVPPEIAGEIREWARHRLQPDPNGNGSDSDEYRITSIYFETGQFDVYMRRGSFGRSKYRIRRYGLEDLVYLERKLKTKGLVSKRRSPVKTVEISALSRVELDRDWTGSWYHRRLQLRGLRPICQIRYERTARVASTERGPIRLTLDENLRAIPTESYLFNDEAQCLAVVPESVILELKFRGEPPLLFKELIETFALNPRRMSKYRLAAAALGLVPANIIEFPAERNSVCLNS